MQIDIRETSPGRAYRMLISAIVPRPIAFVSTLSSAGQRNLAPFSFFMGVSSQPLTLALSVFHRQGVPKDTAANILETGEFVVNLTTEELAQRVALASGDYAREYDEFAMTGLTPVASERVRPPRVGESPVSLECRLHRSMVIGEPPSATHLIVGEVVFAHVRDDLWADGMIDGEKLRPLSRLGANFYGTLGRVIAIDRPKVDEQGKPLQEG